MRFLLMLFIFLSPSSLFAGTSELRELHPIPILKTEDGMTWVELTTTWNGAEFDQRRLIVSRLEMNLNVPSGTALELWVSQSSKSLPWDVPGSIPLDRWVMDERTGGLARFNIQPALLGAVEKNDSNMTLYLKLDAHSAEQILLRLEMISALNLVIHHRDRPESRP